MTFISKKSVGFIDVVPGLADLPKFEVGQRVTVMRRSPVGHYRVPTYLRGRTGVIELLALPKAVHNEEEAFGRNAGSLGFYYRIAFQMHAVWSSYQGSPNDSLHIEVFETWLERSER